MLTEDQFVALLQRPEDDTLDFKKETYNLSVDRKKLALVKDVLCMANTPRDVDSHIVLGVKKHPDGRTDLLGIDSHLDDADIQSQFSDRTYPVPQLIYESINYKGKVFGVIIIPPNRIGPCVPVRDYGGTLRQRQIYFRRGSKNDLANPEDVRRICAWIDSDGRPSNNNREMQPASLEWQQFVDSVHEFSSARKYLLVSNVAHSQLIDQTEVVGAVNWSFVMDLDPYSDRAGLARAVRPTLERRRNIHLVVKGDRPTLNLDRATYWYFARGLAGTEQEVENLSWREWLRAFGNGLREQVLDVAKASLPTPVTVVALWYGPGLQDHLQSIFGELLSAFGDGVEFVILTDNSADIQPVAEKLDACLVAMPLGQLCFGLKSLLVTSQIPLSDDVVLPSSSGAPIALSSSDKNWLEEEIELVHLNAGILRGSERNVGRDFLMGSEISWHELGLQYDVERDQTRRLLKQVQQALGARRSVRISLFHEPGAGGTTVAKRVIWNMHLDYASGILRRCAPRETIERLQRVVALTGQSAVVLADGADVSEGELDELFEYIRARHLPVVIVQVFRRFASGSSKGLTISLKSKLSERECQRFAHILSRESPQREEALNRVLAAEPDRFHTPFYYCLQAFGEDFRRLDSYVSSRLDELTDIQRKIIGLLAIAHHYGQKPIPAEAFRHILSLPASHEVNLPEALSERGLDLVVESAKGEWRTSHDLIAREILKKLLWPNLGDNEQWRQNLSSWAVEFAGFCRGDLPVPSDTMLEVARRTFVYRDNVELLGTERSSTKQFAQLIRDIPAKEGRLEVLRALVEEYPDEAHFLAHLGRFYAIEMQDFEKAVECVDRALVLQPEDSVLHHMKGMALRSLTTSMIEQRHDLIDIIGVAIRASESFTAAREKNPDDEHGYISEVQLISRVLDYAGRQHDRGLVGYLAGPSHPFVRNSLEKCEDLLEQLRRNREGQGPSRFEQECRAKLDQLYGSHENALQAWDNLLQREDVYSPPIRRQIVWTYLARKGRSWDELSVREVSRAQKLLEDNLNEEPDNNRNMRMWIQAVRRVPEPPSIESVIEKIVYWRANTGSIDATYYLYVLYAVLALEGSVSAEDSVRQPLEECRNLARLRRNRTKSFEWVGHGEGLTKIVHHSRLGDWERQSDFWGNTQPLSKVSGRISNIRGSEAGYIAVTDGMSAFFVPAKGGFALGRSENQSVEFFLGFSYDGLRAWDVKPI